MFLTLCILLLVAGAYCDDDLDAVIDEIFRSMATQDKDNAQATTGPAFTTNTENSEGNKLCALPDGQEGECVGYYLYAMLLGGLDSAAIEDQDQNTASTAPSINIDSLLEAVFGPRHKENQDTPETSTVVPTIGTKPKDINAVLYQIFGQTATQDKDNAQASTGSSLSM